MFSMPSSTSEPHNYDFEKEENAAKWRGVFVNALQKVLEQVHPTLSAREDALNYVESLILRLLGMLCARPAPHTIQDVEERVRRTFPTPIDRWALRDAKEALERGKKKSPLVLPVDRVHHMLQKEVLHHKIDSKVSLFVVAILEYMSVDLLKELDCLFSNIIDICELTVTLLGSFEDMLEISEEKQVPAVGSCFEELAEAAEFDAYGRYAKDVTQQRCRDSLTRLVGRPEVSGALQSAGNGFREAVKYYLLKLLLVPVWHCFLYLDYIKILRQLTPKDDDRESLEQVEGLLRPLQIELLQTVGNTMKDTGVRMHGRARRQAALEKTNEMHKSIDGWESKDIGQCCNEFIREDVLGKVSSGKRLTERRVFLFDGLLVLCKPNSKWLSTAGARCKEFRLKERFYMPKVDIIDREDTKDLKNAFEIAPGVQPNVTLVAKSVEEKNDWMADLVMLKTRSMLERTLDSILSNEEKKLPLRQPSPQIYSV